MSKTANFRQQLSELEAIVAWFESEEADIDQAVEKFTKGMELVASLNKNLETTENQIKEITDKFSQATEKKTDSDDES